jgi:hypothetical protein
MTPIEVIGPFRKDPVVQEALVEHVRGEAIPQRVLELEIPPTPERTKQLTGLRAAFLELGHDLGVDLAGSAPSPDQFHFFSSQENLHEALRAMGVNVHPKQEGLTTPRGIFIWSQGSDYEDMCMAAHEAVHKMELIRVAGAGSVSETGLASITKISGYHSYRFETGGEPAIFKGLRELATDLTYIHVRKGGYWDRQPDLPKEDRTLAHYAYLDIIGEELILAAAQHAGTEPLTILTDLERDIFTGKNVALRALTEYLKTSPSAYVTQMRIQELMHASHGAADPLTEYTKLAQQLGLARAAERITLMGQGGKDRVLEWARPRPEAA